MARKRAPGAGRPPRGNLKNKATTFTTRITTETRHALEAAAKKSGRSLSQEAEVGLRYYLEKPAGAARNRALAAIIGSLAETIERDTGLSWRSDIFTSMALRYAVEAFLFHFSPGTAEKPTIPPAVETRAAKMPDELAERHRRPAGFGHMRAYSLITEIENRPRPGKMHDEWTVPIGINASLERIAILAGDLDLEPPTNSESQ
jgi:hypothetical protein